MTASIFSTAMASDDGFWEKRIVMESYQAFPHPADATFHFEYYFCPWEFL
ncbi:MAG: hypothetical protein H8E18_06580 [FCB group bacterium]|nr:hypothetical protein [FCB group bacterium]